ncbi:MAG TPA: LURP-one-related family protein [Anaerolineae bacterium]|nr:LURP-one-related family protein [Anaerolineae bacterium]
MFRRRGGLAKPRRMQTRMQAAAAAQPGAGPAAPEGINRYLMQQRIFALGQDFVIYDAAGQPAFKIDGKVRLIKESLKFRDLEGNELYRLSEKVIRVRDSYDILRGDQVAAQVHNAIFDPLRERFTIEIPDGQDMMTMGKVIWAEYNITRDGQPVAKISKRFSWIRRDQYAVDVVQGEDDCLILAITVVIDMMVSNGR